MWSTASESIRNGWHNSDRLSRSSRLAQPGITAVEQLWLRRRSSHEPNQIHNNFNVFLMYFEDLSMHSGINCASVHQNGGFRSSEKIKPTNALCFAGFACKLAASLLNGININVHFIKHLWLCLNYMWTLPLWINQNIEVVFHRTQRGWKLKLCVKLSSCEVRRFETCNLSVVIVLACCFNTMFTGV